MTAFAGADTTRSARLMAGVIALLAWVGLAVQFSALFAVNGSVAESLGTMLVYFTITTNLLVAALFTGLAIGVRSFASSAAVAGTALSILLVGVVYHLLLRGLRELSGGSAIANALLHQVTPIVVPLFWIVFSPKRLLRRFDPLFWAIYRSATLHTLWRGVVEAATIPIHSSMWANSDGSVSG